MTLLDCYNQHRGTAVCVDGTQNNPRATNNKGQCEQWADLVLHDVYGQPYVYTPAAKDFWYDFDKFPQLKNNFDKISKGQPIKKGDFIIFDPLSSGDPQGHIDVASRDATSLNNFWAYDSNWNAVNHHDTQGYPVLYEVNHADGFNSKVVGYLRKKAAAPPQEVDMVTKTVSDALYKFYLGKSTSDWGLQNAVGKITADALQQHLINSDEFKARIADSAAGKLDVISHLPAALREVYKG